MEKLTITLEPLACEACFEKIQNKLEAQDGVGEVAALFEKNELVVQLNTLETSTDKLITFVQEMGYNIAKTKVD